MSLDTHGLQAVALEPAGNGAAGKGGGPNERVFLAFRGYVTATTGRRRYS
jgi:hypothetical protein